MEATGKSKNELTLDFDAFIDLGISLDSVIDCVKDCYNDAAADASQRAAETALKESRDAVAAAFLNWYKTLGYEFRSKEDEIAIKEGFSKILQIMEKSIQENISKSGEDLLSHLFF